MRVPGVAAVSCGYSKFTEAYSNSLVSVFFVEAFFYFVRGFLLGFAKFCQAAQEGVFPLLHLVFFFFPYPRALTISTYVSHRRLRSSW
jgi:hypothetical protein